jgi:hypothetical protein
MVHLLLILFCFLVDEDPVQLNNEAVELLEQGRFDQAVRLLVTAHNLSPDSERIRENLAGAHAQRGLDAGKKGNYPVAVEDLRAAVRLSKQKAKYRYFEAAILYHMGQLGSAEDAVNRALREPLEEDLAEKIHCLKGNILYLDDRLDEALSAFETALESDAPGEDAAWMKAKIERELLIQKEYQLDSTTYFKLLYDAKGFRLNAQGPFVCLLEEERSRVCTDFNHFPRIPTTVIIYNPQDFTAVTAAESWVGGLFDRKIRIPLTQVNNDLKRIAHVVRHEYTHVVIRELAPTCPSWINEGLASCQEYGPGTGEKRMLALMAKGVKPLPFTDLPLDFFNTADENKVQLYYVQSHAMMEYLIEQYGWGKVRLLLRELNKSGEWQAAFRSAFGRTIDRVEKSWHASLK